MVAIIRPRREPHLVRIEPEDRLVVLARTMQARHPEAEAALRDSAVHWTRFGETCLGQALYRHRSVVRSAAEAPVWSHLELSYFRGLIPAEAIVNLVQDPQPAGTDLLRAELLLTTPASFVLPRAWQGSADRPVSLEYIDVQAAHLTEYREVMRRYCGPAAAKLVQANRFGTFRAMETAAVLYRAPAFRIDWNQIHLCEVDAGGFNGFGQEFAAALRDSPDGADIARIFADLDRIRTLPRWTFNDPVVEAEAALAP
ncbi:hypothetical protein JMJ55_06055 [Belnapia sp. T6]|uniref:EthD domain-containing protein n=1 Tax=Belnapia mucosa TaxID=2804532 RepID=A0ABS1UZJ9_9PROT|nr:hypothetical protein [Belnapia mucosa]MBL6454878.1 hypothetical protein [Belnapia mucosa]